MANRTVRATLEVEASGAIRELERTGKAADSAADKVERVGGSGSDEALERLAQASAGAAEEIRNIGGASAQASQDSGGALSRMAQSARDHEQDWRTAGTALATYGAAVTGLSAAVVVTGINYNTLRQRSVAALTTLTGSAEGAVAQMDKLDDFATNSPFARDVFIKAQQQLMGFGFEAERVVPILDAVQNAVAATGGSNHQISELVTIIAQMGASAKITASDLREFGNRGVDAASIIGEQMGKTGAQIREEITAGTLDADAAIEALVVGMNDRFGGAAANVKETMDGAVDRVKAAIRDIGAGFASVLVNPEGGGLLVDALNAIADVLRRFEDLPPGIQNTVIALTGLSGVAALATGGFMLMAPRVVETIDALRRLNILTPRVETRLRGAGRAAGIAAGTFASLMILGEIGDAAFHTERDMARLENQVRTLTTAASNLDTILARTQLDEDWFTLPDPERAANTVESLRQLADPGLYGGISNTTDSLIRFFSDGLADYAASDFTDLKNDIADFDTVMADIAGQSLPDATEAFNGWVEAFGGGEEVAKALLDVMPEYRSQLTQTATEMNLAADDATLLAIATGQIAPVAEEAATAVGKIADGFGELDQELQDAAAEVYAANGDILNSFINLSEGIDDADISLEEWYAQFASQMEAQAAFAENIATLRGKGMNEAFLQGMIAEGPAAAGRLQEITDAVVGGDEEWLARGDELGSALAGEAHQAATEVLTSGDPIAIEARIDASETRSELESIFYDDPAEVPVDADDAPAREAIEGTVAFALEQQGIVKFDADGTLAHVKIDEWNDAAANTTGMPELDADPMLAHQQLLDYLNLAKVTTGVATLDANGDLAFGETNAWQNDANTTWGTATLSANNGPALAALNQFLNRIPASVSVSIRAVPIVGNLFPGSYAGGGYVQDWSGGGFTGHGSTYQERGTVHAGEFVHKKFHVSQPGMRQFHEELWRTDDLDRAYANHKARGYRTGGEVGGGSRSSGGSSTGTLTGTVDATAMREAAREGVREGFAGMGLYVSDKQAGIITARGNQYASVIPGGGRP